MSILKCVCQNCGWKGKPDDFSGSLSQWMNDQDQFKPVILPQGDCPKCRVPVYFEAAIKAMQRYELIGELVLTLKDVFDCEHDRDEESRNFGPTKLKAIEALLAKTGLPPDFHSKELKSSDFYTIAFGDCFNGLSFHGVYLDHDEAEEDAELHRSEDEEYHIIEIKPIDKK